MIETERLRLIPLNMVQEMQYLEDKPELEEQMGLLYKPKQLPDELKQVIRRFILPLFLREPSDYYYFTSWIAVDLNLSQIVADLSFKGRPDENGSTEIGYGTFHPYRNQGYMSEALGGMLSWAFLQNQVKEVRAETKSDNLFSTKVLRKNNFKLIEDSGEFLHWKKEKIINIDKEIIK